MIAVSDNFKTEAGKTHRTPEYAVFIDWNLDGSYTEETGYLLLIGVERSILEPLGGVSLGQADVVLANYEGRYSPEDVQS